MEWFTSMAKTICLLSAPGNLPHCSSLWHWRSFNSEFEWWATSAIDRKDVIVTHFPLSVLTQWSPLLLALLHQAFTLFAPSFFSWYLRHLQAPIYILAYRWTICIFTSSLNCFGILRVNSYLQSLCDILSHVAISTCCCVTNSSESSVSVLYAVKSISVTLLS